MSENTEIVHVMPLELTLELQKCATLEAAATTIFKAVAVAVKDSLGKPESAALSVWLDKNLKALNTTDEILKKTLKKHCIEQGEVVSDAGSKRLQLGEYIVPVTAKGKDSYDDKRVEAFLRANGLGFIIDCYMDEHKSYTVNDKKLAALVKDYPELAAGLENCKKEVSYALMPLKRVNNEE